MFAAPPSQEAAGTALLVAVTRGNCIWRIPLLPDGTTTKVGVFIQLTGGVGPDGLALDAVGNLAVAHAGLGSVWIFDPFGEPLWRIRSCTGRLTTNLAYGGADGRSLFITEFMRVNRAFILPSPVSGRCWASCSTSTASRMNARGAAFTRAFSCHRHSTCVAALSRRPMPWRWCDALAT
jgi:hypothetical protein